MTREQIIQNFPHATESFIRANIGQAGSAPQSPKPQPVVRPALARAPEREEGHSGRFLVRIKSFRRVLTDPDNLCGKYFLDCLRYAKIIPNDRPQDIDYQITQGKVERGGVERTEIEVIPI